MPLATIGDIAVWSGGYAWKECEPPAGKENKRGDWWRRRLVKAHGAGEYRFHDPFKDSPALFLDFAAIPLELPAIAEFAGRHGPLTVDGDDYLATWRNTITDMRDLTSLLRDYAKVDFARDFLDGVLNNRHFAARAEMAFLRDDRGFWTPTVKLRNLVDVFYLQFGLAMQEQRQFRACDWCGKHFEVLQKRPNRERRGRTDRRFCSDSCRVKAYLRRRETAVQMRAGGARLRDISREVKTDLETLKKWLGE